MLPIITNFQKTVKKLIKNLMGEGLTFIELFEKCFFFRF